MLRRPLLALAVVLASPAAAAGRPDVLLAEGPGPAPRPRDAALAGALVEEPPAPEASWLAVALATGSGGTVGEAPGVYPPLARLFLGGTTTWRHYCARPGVKSCGEFDRKSPEEQLGDTHEVSPGVPYLGLSAELELLPLARSPSAARGLGVVLGYRRGFASTDVTLRNDAGQSTTREAPATDSVLTAQALYRYFFGRGAAGELLGYAGLRAGLLTRSFDVAEEAESFLTSTHRLFPAVGLEVSEPLLRTVRLEGGGQVFIGSKPGQGGRDAQVREYGTSVSSFGWEADLGLAGDLWGPLGYSLRFRLSRYQDTFSGAGTRTGWQNGGVAAETYSSLQWGITGSY